MADSESPIELSDEYQGRYRNLEGFLKAWQSSMLALIPVLGAIYILDIPAYLGILIWKEQYLGLFLALVLGSVFLSVLPTSRNPHQRVPWFDIVLALLGLGVGIYITVFYPSYSLGYKTSLEPYLGLVAILLVLEATRRLLGWILVIMAGCFILYAKFADLFPGKTGKSMLGSFQVDLHEENQIVEDGGNHGGKSDLRIGNPEKLRYEKGRRAHDRGHNDPSGGSGSFNRRRHMGTKSCLNHHRDSYPAIHHDVRHGAAAYTSEQSARGHGDLCRAAAIAPHDALRKLGEEDRSAGLKEHTAKKHEGQHHRGGGVQGYA